MICQQVLISLLIYILFMLDAMRTTVWERLDDYVYYIRATGNTIEFIFGIFLFFNGAWILLFESGGTIRAFMMCIHAYFNIWLQAKQGWQKFIKRRQAVHKIESLREATDEQLRQFNDVCAICYQDLQSARITRCNHYFHGACLRKWLYVQDICPLCHQTLHSTDLNQSSDSNQSNQPQQNNQNGRRPSIVNDVRPPDVPPADNESIQSSIRHETSSLMKDDSQQKDDNTEDNDIMSKKGDDTTISESLAGPSTVASVISSPGVMNSQRVVMTRSRVLRRQEAMSSNTTPSGTPTPSLGSSSLMSSSLNHPHKD